MRCAGACSPSRASRYSADCLSSLCVQVCAGRYSARTKISLCAYKGLAQPRWLPSSTQPNRARKAASHLLLSKGTRSAMSQPSEDTNSKAQASRVFQERDGDKAAMADVSQSGGRGSGGACGISERAERIVARSASPYYAGWKEVARNPYDKVTNPEGCIQLGLAENMVSP